MIFPKYEFSLAVERKALFFEFCCALRIRPDMSLCGGRYFAGAKPTFAIPDRISRGLSERWITGNNRISGKIKGGLKLWQTNYWTL